MKISAFKRQGLAVFEDRGGAGTRTCRAGSSTTGIDRHAGPTSTLSHGDEQAGPTGTLGRGGRRGAGEIESLFLI